MSTPVAATFVPAARGRLFVVVHGSLSDARAVVFVAPAFADEMNKSRHLVARVATGLAARGIATVIADPRGTGDSDGEFEDGDWAGWIADLEAVRAALDVPRVGGLLAVRTGALLGMAAASHWKVPRVVLWQPVLDGAKFVAQFLRIRVAAAMAEGRRESVDSLRARIAAGESIEVGGYPLVRAVTAGLDAARLEPLLAGFDGELNWLEVADPASPEISPGSRALIERVRAAGTRIVARAIGGEPFWGASELVRPPDLVESTIAALQS